MGEFEEKFVRLDAEDGGKRRESERVIRDTTRPS